LSSSRQRRFDLDPVATRNRLLAQLSESERKALVGIEKVHLEARQVLEVPGTPISSVYFVERGLVSVVGTTRPNHRIEVGMIGFEGMTGTAIVLGDDLSANEAIVQSSGEAFRISASDLRVAMLQHPRMAILFGHYIHVFMTQGSQTAVANGRGRLGERLARWILMWHDRIGGEALVVTHEFLSILLGFRRAGVTVALHALEARLLIKASRTLIRVLDRNGLQAAANGFYGIPEAEYDRLIGPLALPGSSVRD
jgi:CRP-like cAMP-binding protein